MRRLLLAILLTAACLGAAPAAASAASFYFEAAGNGSGAATATVTIFQPVAGDAGTIRVTHAGSAVDYPAADNGGSSSKASGVVLQRGDTVELIKGGSPVSGATTSYPGPVVSVGPCIGWTSFAVDVDPAFSITAHYSDAGVAQIAMNGSTVGPLAPLTATPPIWIGGSQGAVSSYYLLSPPACSTPSPPPPAVTTTNTAATPAPATTTTTTTTTPVTNATVTETLGDLTSAGDQKDLGDQIVDNARQGDLDQPIEQPVELPTPGKVAGDISVDVTASDAAAAAKSTMMEGLTELCSTTKSAFEQIWAQIDGPLSQIRAQLAQYNDVASMLFGDAALNQMGNQLLAPLRNVGTFFGVDSSDVTVDLSNGLLGVFDQVVGTLKKSVQTVVDQLIGQLHELCGQLQDQGVVVMAAAKKPRTGKLDLHKVRSKRIRLYTGTVTKKRAGKATLRLKPTKAGRLLLHLGKLKMRATTKYSYDPAPKGLKTASRSSKARSVTTKKAPVLATLLKDLKLKKKSTKKNEK